VCPNKKRDHPELWYVAIQHFYLITLTCWYAQHSLRWASAHVLSDASFELLRF